MNRSFFFLLGLVVTLCVSNLHAVDIMFEDFEDSTINYTAPADALTDINSRDYYGRVQLNTGGADLDDLPTAVSYTNVQGTRFYGFDDIDGAEPVAITNGSPLNLDFSINILSYENLEFSVFVAEDDDGTNQDWDDSEHFLVSYRIDGTGSAPYTSLFAIEAAGAMGATNEQPLEDTDFDGIGDGTAITDAFTQFTKSIAGTGTTLDLRIHFQSDSVHAQDEDLAFDSVTITGDLVPEPKTAGLLGIALLGLGYIRRHGSRYTCVGDPQRCSRRS